MRIYLIACEIFTRELAFAVAKSPHRTTLKFLPFKLHTQGGKAMAAELQKAVDEVPDGYDAVALAFCLCNNGLLGLKARKAPLVAFRSHDCIACLLGSMSRFESEREACPGSYWLSSGWVELAQDASDQISSLPAKPEPNDPRWLDLVEKYGEDNAEFLWEEQRKALAHYERLVYIDNELGPQTVDKEEARKRAEAMNLRYEETKGSRDWIEALLDGPWDEKRFLVVKPGFQVAPRYDEAIVEAVPAQP